MATDIGRALSVGGGGRALSGKSMGGGTFGDEKSPRYLDPGGHVRGDVYTSTLNCVLEINALTPLAVCTPPLDTKSETNQRPQLQFKASGTSGN